MGRPGSGGLTARRAAATTEEPPDELRLRLLAVPAALAVAALFSHGQMGHALQRLLFGMPLHELGHALTALALGVPAFPLPWRTPMADARSPLLVGLLLGGAAALLVLGRRNDRRDLVAAGTGLALLVAVGLTVSRPTARALIAFGGDAGAMVLGTLLMCTVFAGETSRFRQGALRWGLLVIGAAAYSDVASTWWAARRDPGEIPLGQFEGGGLSDASVLVETAGWTERALVNRYTWLAGLCLAALAVVWTFRALRPYLRARSD